MRGSRMTIALQRERLRDLDVLRELDEPVFEAVVNHLKGVRFAEGTEIVRYGDTTHDVYFVVDGEVRVNMVAASGRAITYQVMERGQMFGELSAIDHLPRSTSNVAEVDTTVARLDGRSFRELVATQPQFAFVVMQRLASLTRWLTERVFEYHTFDVRGRVYSELLRLVEAHADTSVIHLTDRDMASRVGTTRENVTRIYGELRRKGVIARAESGITILDLDQLEDLRDESEFS